MRTASFLSAAASVVLTSLLLLVPIRGRSAERFTSDAEAISQVLDLAAKRLGLMRSVAAWKWQNGTPIVDEARERAVVGRALAVADSLAIAPDGVRKLFEVQLQLARELQEDLHRRWANEGFEPAEAPPDLTQVRLQLDRLTVDILRATYLAATALASTEFSAAYRSTADEHLHALGWTESQRNRLLDALSAIRRAASPTLDNIRTAGVLRVGMTGDYAPFSDVANGQLTGVDVELAKRLAAALAVVPIYVRTSWPELESDLRANRFDVAMSGISITPARRDFGAFSQPYAVSGKTIIARCRDASRYPGLAELDQSGVRVIVNPGGTNEQYVRAHLRRAELQVFPDNQAIFGELQAGRADAMITDDVEAELQTRRHPDLCRTFPGRLTESQKAILMRRDPRLVEAVDHWLTVETRDGRPAKLIQEFLGK